MKRRKKIYKLSYHMFKDYFYQNIQRFNSYSSKWQVAERISSQVWCQWVKPRLTALCISLLQKWPVTNVQWKNKRTGQVFSNIFPQELPAFRNKCFFTLLASTTSTGYEVHKVIKHYMQKQYKYENFKISSQILKNTLQAFDARNRVYISSQKKNLNMIIGNISTHFQQSPVLHHIKETLKRNLTQEINFAPGRF